MISILIPTRKRRAGLERTVQSALDTAHSPECLEFVAYVDDDDLLTYADFKLDVKFVHGPRIVLSNTWNKCAAIAIGEIFCQGNDDCIWRTSGWDTMIYDEFAKYTDKILMVHGADGSGQTYASGRGEFAVHPCLHRRWYETLGYLTPPFFSSDFGDSWIGDLANAIGRRKYLPFIIEHMHYVFGKAPIDQTTSERLARHSNDNVEKLYKDLAPLREIDIEKLKAAMQ